VKDENKKRTEERYNTVNAIELLKVPLRKNRTIIYKGEVKMNKNKTIAFRVTDREYESIKNKSKELGFKNVSLYARKKMLTDKDEYLNNVDRIRNLYDHLAQLEMEFETIKNEARLSEYDILGYEREFADIEEELKKIK